MQVWGAAEINLGYELSEDHKRVLLLVLKVCFNVVVRGSTVAPQLLPTKHERFDTPELELSDPLQRISLLLGYWTTTGSPARQYVSYFTRWLELTLETCLSQVLQGSTHQLLFSEVFVIFCVLHA